VVGVFVAELAGDYFWGGRFGPGADDAIVDFGVTVVADVGGDDSEDIFGRLPISFREQMIGEPGDVGIGRGRAEEFKLWRRDTHADFLKARKGNQPAVAAALRSCGGMNSKLRAAKICSSVAEAIHLPSQ
jgi:hypothetical protein